MLVYNVSNMYNLNQNHHYYYYYHLHVEITRAVKACCVKKRQAYKIVCGQIKKSVKYRNTEQKRMYPPSTCLRLFIGTLRLN